MPSLRVTAKEPQHSAETRTLLGRTQCHLQPLAATAHPLHKPLQQWLEHRSQVAYEQGCT